MLTYPKTEVNLQMAMETLAPHRLERIGAGFCGTVWSAPDTTGPPESVQELLPVCVKREDGGPYRSINNEQHVQFLVNESIIGCSESSFTVPRCYGFITKADTEAWDRLLKVFPSSYQGCNAMISETIQPISASARRRIIDRYCPLSARGQIAHDGTNLHCLLRLYLGRRRQPNQLNAKRRFFSLRNFPLHLDQVEEMQLPAAEYACAMAKGLAFMNWAVGIDGNDVEFVLASPRSQSPMTEKSSGKVWTSPLIGGHSLWLLDFDCCHEISPEACVEQTARSFWRNEPYFPRPKSDLDDNLWKVFAEEYQRSSLDLIPRGPLRDRLDQKPAVRVARILTRIEESREEYIKG